MSLKDEKQEVKPVGTLLIPGGRGQEAGPFQRVNSERNQFNKVFF